MAFTYFFRDMQTLEMVRDHVVPALRTNRYINIWDAGCAHGPEPYSIAIMLRENMGEMIFRNVKIIATDIDESNLFGRTITDGIYPDGQVRRIPEEIFRKYFVPSDRPEHFRVIEEIRKCVSYQRHDLLSCRPVRMNFGLIVCKNVLLHFSEQDRIAVLEMFCAALSEGGFFVTEQTQKMPEKFKGYFERMASNVQIFQKKQENSHAIMRGCATNKNKSRMFTG